MPAIYEIEVYEIHVQKVHVMADSEAAAIKALYDGDGDEQGPSEFIEMARDLGLPCGPGDEFQELGDALIAIGIQRANEDTVEGIRSIEKIEDLPE